MKLNEPEMRDLLKSLPEIKHLSDELQSDILEFAVDAYDSGYDEGVEDINETAVGIKWAYYEYEDISSWDEFTAKRDELFKRHLSGC